MRNMSFSKTTQQMRDRTKTVTRRAGWNHLRVGHLLCACVKCQGLKKGEQLERIGILVVKQVWCEPLGFITQEDVIREGFPGMTPAEFVEMFCRDIGGGPDQHVRRIEFAFVPGSNLAVTGG